MNCDGENQTVDDAASSPVVAGPTTSATVGAASARANSASASSTGVRTRVAEGPEVYPPTEPAPARSFEKNPPKGAYKGKEDRKPPSLPSIVNSESGNLTVDDAAGPTSSETEGAAPARADSASAPSTSARTRVTERPEVYPPMEPVPVHSVEKNTLKGTSDVATLPRAPANDLYTQELTLESTKYASQIDTEQDKVIDNAAEDASVPGDSRIAVSAAPEVYPPTPRQGSLDDADAHANNQKMQRKSAKASMADLPPCPEEVPIKDPGECQDHADESLVLRSGNKRRNRAAEGRVTDSNETRSQASDDEASSAETEDVPDIFSDEPASDQSSPALQTTPGAVAVTGITSNDDDMEFTNHEGPSQGTPQDRASDVEAAEASQEATLHATGAHVVNDRGQHTATTRNTPTEVPLVSAEAVPDANVPSRKCSPREYSRRTWAKVVSFVAVIVAAVTLMGVLIPQESSAATQEGVQGSQSSADPSPIPTSFPSHLPSLNPTDPDTLRFNSIQSILVPISGLEVLLDTTTPQYRALEWVSLNDTLQLPHNTEAERKRVVQRYVLAVLYYASGGQHWHKSHRFLEGIHECAWWSWVEQDDGTVAAEGALCTKGYEVGEISHLDLNNNNMTGSLPAELQYLSDLDHLHISGNFNLGGPIPGFNEKMTSLALLNLYRNMHTGTIPSSLGRLSNLERLRLFFNGLTGTIPESFGNLTSLRTLDLYYNKLNGTIPLVLGQLSSLRYLNLRRNPLTGEIPNELCHRKESGDLDLEVDTLTANRTKFVCECIPVEGLLGCCVVTPDFVGDGYCHPDEPYYTEACKYDNGDCPTACPEGTSPVAGKNMSACCVERPYYIGNGLCDNSEAYNTEACGYDGGDCCESTCQGFDCGKNGYNCKDPTVNITCLDAEGLEGCCVEYPSQIGDGYCHPYEPYYMEACKYDNGDCPAACPEGTFPPAGKNSKNMSACCVFEPGLVGDGWCDDYDYDYDYDYDVPYNTEACGYDGGDCCEETCEGDGCGSWRYNCKDPTISSR